jgi:hypothetical protein
MSWMDAIGGIVSRYTSAGGGAASAPADPHGDYRTIAQSAPQQVMSDALSSAFRSDQTPSFPEMLSSLFRQSNPDQRAGLLNRIIGEVGPAALAGVPALKGLAGSTSGSQEVTPQTASQVSPEQIQQMATHAQRNNPSIVERVSDFYAQHPDVVKALGGAAITIAIQRIAQRRSA